MSEYTDSPIVIQDSDHAPEEVAPAPEQNPAPIMVQTEVSSPTAPPVTEAPIVVEAPVSHGRSFVLRNFFNGQTQIGQMLVLAHRNMRDAAIEVLETYFPAMEPGRTFGKGQNRFYMGDRKIPNEYWPLIFEMKISRDQAGKKLFEYRLLYPSGKTLRKWGPLNLGVLKLKTTEEQRAMISAFTGIVYKLRQTEPNKQTNYPDRNRNRPSHPPRQQPRMGGIFERAGVKVGEVKHKIQEAKKPNAPVRGDLQCGLQAEPVPPAVPAAGASSVEAPAPAADPVGETDSKTDVAPDGIGT